MRAAAALRIPALLLVGQTACSPPAEPDVPPSAAPVATTPVGAGVERHFRFATLDGSLVTEESLKGRLTLIALVATYDAASQAETRFVQSVFHSYKPRINALLLVLEPPQNLPLVEAYASSLDLRFPVALADPETIAGKGPFEGLHHVPSVVILDREGREVWRKLGLVDDKELAATLDGLSRR